MRPGQQNKRGRGRNNNNNNNNNNSNNNGNMRKGSNPLTRTYDSSGPDVKIRGTAQHIAEKYAQLARDAQSSGDRVMAENYLQHAEHYNRIIASAQAQMQERYQRDERSDFADRDEDDNGSDAAPVQQSQPQQQRSHQQAQPQAEQPYDGSGPQPDIEGIPAEVILGEEAPAEAAAEQEPRQRRPRRPQRRRQNAAAEGEAGETPAEQPALAEAGE
ncbi:protein of unknown function [Ensifer adhaerens]|nr:protein of unknown function [Ensifer adhaerens]HZG30342.1 DUF4167 domain-containing protein [Ensifer sp.]